MGEKNLPRLLWRPLPSSGKNLKDLMAKINTRHGTNIADYMSLWRWSTAPQTAPLFWLQLVEFLGIKFDRSPERAFETKVRPVDISVALF